MVGQGGEGTEPLVRLTLQADILGTDLCPGQHLQVRVANISGMQWHPYSVAAVRPPEVLAPAPARAGWDSSQPDGQTGELTQLEAVSAAGEGPRVSDGGGSTLDIYVKSMAPGSWSDQLCSIVAKEWFDETAAIKALGPIQVEGPYGGFQLAEGEGAGARVLVAGGIGVTPLASLLQVLGRQAAAAAAGGGQERERGVVHLWWSCRDAARLSELAAVLPLSGKYTRNLSLRQ